MTRPTVSVALATYNGATHLAEQLGDLANQSRLPCELIACDDGSSDDTVAVLEHFATSAPFPVRIHRNRARVGYRRNFVQCAGLCAGELIAFCDQDDRWSPRKLEAIAAHFEHPETMLVFHNARVVSPSGEGVAKLHGDGDVKSWGPLTASPWMFALGFTQVFRRQLTQFDTLWADTVDQNCDGEPLAHDQWYFFLASVIGRVVYLPDVLADYRQHSANTYGWRGIAASLLSRISEEAGDASRAVERRSAAADSRAAILRHAAGTAEAPWRRQLVRGSDKYREFAGRYRLRAALYEGRSYGERGRAFRQLLRAHAYGRDAWRIGPLGFAMDSLVGLTGIGSRRSSARDRT